MTTLDAELCTAMAKSIEKLTHSGQKTLDKKELENVANICKRSFDYIQRCFDLIMFNLKKDHSEVRLSAFQIMAAFFRCSNKFRELVVDELGKIFELVFETNEKKPLPKPYAVAKLLKRTGLEAVKEWYRLYGGQFLKIQAAYNSLKRHLNVEALEIESATERRRNEEKEKKQGILDQEKIKKLLKEIKESEEDIQTTITSIESCITLLVPSPENFYINLNETEENNKEKEETKKDNSQNSEIDNDDDDDDDEEFHEISGSESDDDDDNDQDGNILNNENHLRRHGIDSNFSLDLNIDFEQSTVKETSDNSVIFENARELCSLLRNRYIPIVKGWNLIITKHKGDPTLLKQVLDLKDKLEQTLNRCVTLGLDKRKRNNEESDDESTSDEEFEEVHKEGFENNFMPPLPKQVANPVGNLAKGTKPKDWKLCSDDHENDPTSLKSTLKKLQEQEKKNIKTDNQTKTGNKSLNKAKETRPIENEPLPSTSKGLTRKEKLLAIAPKLPFDVDLYHWEDEKIPVPTMLAVSCEGSRFWSVPDEDLSELPIPEGAAALRTRVIEFSGKFEPIQWECRAPLQSGRLCPRKDRIKCPFHGKIIARNVIGEPSNSEEALRWQLKVEENNRKQPDWQDPALLADIKNQTGIDLKISDKKSKKKKRRVDPDHAGLTDLKAKDSTTYSRLSKKIFNKGAVKRISQRMDALDQKRFRDKYGDQFQYIHDTV